MMIISAQFAESGFIDLCARTITDSRRGTAALLALTVAIGGGLSAILATDILIIAIVTLLIAGAQSRGFDPRPFVYRPRRGDQCRLGRHLDWQPAEHPDRVTRPARLLEFPGDLRRAGAVQPGGDLCRRLAAVAGAHQQDRARGDARPATGDPSSARPQSDDQGGGRDAGIARSVHDAAAARDWRADHCRFVAGEP